MTFVDYYELLQVAPTADVDVIKVAYKRLALKYHPDSGTSTKSEEMMKQLNEAHDVLTDTTKRSIYDNKWQTENEKKTKIKIAKTLLDQKKYTEAKAILIGVDHPTAHKWIAQIDRKLEAQKSSTASDKTSSSTFTERTRHHQSSSPNRQRTNDFSFDESRDPKSPSRKPSYGFEPQDPVEREIRNIRARADARQAVIDKQISDALEQLRKKDEHERILIGVYQKIGQYAFEWKGYTDNRSTEGQRKVRAWNAIHKKRYEEAKFNVIQLIKWQKADSNVLDWLIIINYILGTETFGRRIKRLGLRGIADYPIEGVGCASRVSTCGIMLAAGVCFVVLWSLASRGDSVAQCCLLGLGAIFFYGLL